LHELRFDPAKELDFIAIGRLCIDLNANELHRPLEEVRTFTKYVGGSPANITVALSRLGVKTGFIGRVSADQHGRFVKQYMAENGIDTSHIVTDKPGSVTGLAFTEIKSPTDCSILMYRDNVADLNLEPGDVKEDYVKKAKALLISGTALARSPSREAVFLALHYAHKHGVVTFFDLDYRPYTWASPEEVAIYYHLVAEKCDVLLGGREEFDRIEALYAPEGGGDQETAWRYLEKRSKIVVIKHGEKGSVAFTKDGQVYRQPIFPANVVKSFGAGDSFAGAFIYGLLRGWSLERCLEFGSAAASIVVSSHSCSDAMPTEAQIREVIAAHQTAK